MSHRLFFGIRPPRAIREALIDRMDGVENARWQDDDQLHLTLRFIGEVETHVADDIAEAAEAIRFDPFDLAVAGCGAFERKGMAQILYAAISDSQPLTNLQRKVERTCVKTGIEAEGRKFVPHITLARLNTASGSIAPFLAANAGLSLGPWRVEGYILYESELRMQGSLYRPIVTYHARAT